MSNSPQSQRGADPDDSEPKFLFRVELSTDSPAEVARALASHRSVQTAEIRDPHDDETAAPLVDAYIASTSPEARRAVVAQTELIVDGIHDFDCEFRDCEPCPEASSTAHWREFFEPVRVSRRLRAGPPWAQFRAPEDGVRLVVTPGIAFGIGTHGATQLAARLLEEHLDEGDAPPNVLDVGCGSGILAMLAAKLGARTTRGIDIDAHAIEVARNNLTRNDLSDDVTVEHRDLTEESGRFDLVVCNVRPRSSEICGGNCSTASVPTAVSS